LEIKDKVGLENVVADHLSHLGHEAAPSQEIPVDDSFLDDHLLVISHQATLWYADFVSFKVCGVLAPGLSYQQRKKLLSDAKYYVWEESALYKLHGDGVYR